MFGSGQKKLGKSSKQPVVRIPELPTELRFAPRRDIFADVLLKTSNGQEVKGIVLDVSKCGARLRFVTADSMTDRVQVEIPRLRTKKSARVCWKTRTDIGVKFLD